MGEKSDETSGKCVQGLIMKKNGLHEYILKILLIWKMLEK
jgi:hypothetical protein